MKYKTRQENISYSKLKAKERREKLQTIESKLKICEEKIAESPTDENLVNLTVRLLEPGHPEQNYSATTYTRTGAP